MKKLKNLLRNLNKKPDTLDNKGSFKTDEIDDTGLTDFRLSDLNRIRIGKYQVTESENDEFEVLDELVIEKILEDGLVISIEGRPSKKYTLSELKSVETISLSELDAMFDE